MIALFVRLIFSDPVLLWQNGIRAVGYWPTIASFTCVLVLARTSDVGQSGIISCLSFNSQISGMYAAGSYARTSEWRSVLMKATQDGLSVIWSGSMAMLVENWWPSFTIILVVWRIWGFLTMVIDCTVGREKSVSSIETNRRRWSFLKDGMLLCWDVRNLGELLCTYQRHVDTNQRIYFDFDS